MKTHPVHIQWPEAARRSIWGRAAAAFRPAVIALTLLPILVWAASRLAQLMDMSALELAGQSEVGHAVISGVNVALLGIVVVIVLCGVYGAAGWAAGGVVQGVVALWPGMPKSRLGCGLEMAALTCAWGALFYLLHSAVLMSTLPACAGVLLKDSLLLWFGAPGLVYAWAAVLRRGNQI